MKIEVRSSKGKVISERLLPAIRRKAREVMDIVCSHFGISLVDVLARERAWLAAWPRFLVCHFLRTFAELKARQIAPLVRRSECSVFHALRRVREEISTSKQSRSDVSRIEGLLSERFGARQEAAT